MPNGSTHSDRLQQDLGVTNQRVFTVEKGLADLSSAQERQGLRLSAEIEGVFTKLTSEIRNLSPQFAERTKVPWGAIGVMQVGVIALGGVLYWPIRENQSDFKDALRELKTTMISRSDVDYKFSVTGQRRDDFQRMSEQRDKEMDSKIEQIRDRIVPRSEHEEKWRGNEQRFNDMQRQVDDQKRAFGDTFSLRDALQQMQKRIDTLETIRTAR